MFKQRPQNTGKSDSDKQNKFKGGKERVRLTKNAELQTN